MIPPLSQKQKPDNELLDIPQPQRQHQHQHRSPRIRTRRTRSDDKRELADETELGIRSLTWGGRKRHGAGARFPRAAELRSHGGLAASGHHAETGGGGRKSLVSSRSEPKPMRRKPETQQPEKPKYLSLLPTRPPWVNLHRPSLIGRPPEESCVLVSSRLVSSPAKLTDDATPPQPPPQPQPGDRRRRPRLPDPPRPHGGKAVPLSGLSPQVRDVASSCSFPPVLRRSFRRSRSASAPVL
ncbi:hypothetical protein DAI22_03g364550 [Oryza sativa Japonica Group]|nr:hypothetical protein DAI22_03g364550 [Oryza sativa Japonica Group]